MDQITLPNLTPELLSLIAGGAISLFCTYFPGVKLRWNSLDADHKATYMFFVLAGLTGLIFGAGCLGWISGATCTLNEGYRFATIFIAALLTNQAVYNISPGKERLKMNAATWKFRQEKLAAKRSQAGKP